MVLLFEAGRAVHVQDLLIPGHTGAIRLRAYRADAGADAVAEYGVENQAAYRAACLAADRADHRADHGAGRPAQGRGGWRGLHAPIVLCLHGGSFIDGTLGDIDELASAIARGLDAWVISVAYSLAPLRPFPAGLEDAYCALRWAAGHATAMGADPARIAVVGHEAGANLATCLAAMARDRAEVNVSAQALLSPLLDPSLTCVCARAAQAASDASLAYYGDAWRAYLPHVAQCSHPYAAPLETRRLAGLPPAFIAVAGSDPFRIEGERYHARLAAAGIPAALSRHARATRQSLVRDTAVARQVVDFLAGMLFGARGSGKKKPRANLHAV
jgi:acetyl esterase